MKTQTLIDVDTKWVYWYFLIVCRINRVIINIRWSNIDFANSFVFLTIIGYYFRFIQSIIIKYITIYREYKKLLKIEILVFSDRILFIQLRYDGLFNGIKGNKDWDSEKINAQPKKVSLFYHYSICSLVSLLFVSYYLVFITRSIESCKAQLLCVSLLAHSSSFQYLPIQRSDLATKRYVSITAIFV